VVVSALAMTKSKSEKLELLPVVELKDTVVLVLVCDVLVSVWLVDVAVAVVEL
jgi:hypothetical protein